MAPNDQVFKIFHKLLNAGEPVTLLNNYRGFPIAYPATILTLEQGYVAVGIHEHQVVSMALEGKTYIQSSWLPEVIRASAAAVDVVKKRAVLTEFEPAGSDIGKRSVTRVQPEELLEADIASGRRRLKCRIADISTNGVGVCTFEAYIYGSKLLEQDNEVEVGFRLPTTETIVRFHGVVTSIVDMQDDCLHRLGLRILPDPELQPLLDAYIQKRQHETERELSLIYNSMHQEKITPGKP